MSARRKRRSTCSHKKGSSKSDPRSTKGSSKSSKGSGKGSSVSSKKKSKKTKTVTVERVLKQRSQLATGLLVNVYMNKNQETEDQPAFAHFEVDNATTQNAVLNLDFSACKNVTIQADSKKGSKVTATIGPYHKETVAVITHDDFSKPWSFGWGGGFQLKKPDTKTLSEFASKDQEEIKKKLKLWKKLFDPEDEAEDIMRKCHEKKTNFVDPDFPPCDESVGEGTLKELKHAVTWRRPSEFMKKKVNLFHEGIEPQDIRQGSLGNCWVMSSFSVLAERANRIKGIFMNDESNDYGVYQLCLFKNGKRHYVTIDDYFPCYPNSGPCFSKNRGDELWVLLLEKAYAKLNGSYTALKGGNANQALGDLTGCPSREYLLESDKLQAEIKSGKFWKRMLKYAAGDDASEYLMAISTKDGGKRHKLKGLVPGHAYALLDNVTVQDKKGKDRYLMQLRNPWGKFEWNGKWSDASSEWTPELKKKLGWSSADDGIFWMELKDVLTYFGSLSVCRLMERWPSRQWDLQFKRFELRKGKKKKSGKGESSSSDEEDSVLDPKYYEGVRFRPKQVFHLHLKEGSGSLKLIVSLHQEDVRVKGSLPFTDIAVYIAEVEMDDDSDDEDAEQIVGIHTLMLGGPKVDRDVFCKEITLKEGKAYYLIPFSWGTRVTVDQMEQKKFEMSLRWSEKGKLRVSVQKCYNQTLLLLQQMKIDRVMKKGDVTVLAKKEGEVRSIMLSEGNMSMCVLENQAKKGFSVKPQFTFKTRNMVSGRKDGKFVVNDKVVKYGERELVFEAMQKDVGGWSCGFAGKIAMAAEK